MPADTAMVGHIRLAPGDRDGFGVQKRLAGDDRETAGAGITDSGLSDRNNYPAHSAFSDFG
jgi:hypothetical protein